jgi:hypothetical protein
MQLLQFTLGRERSVAVSTEEARLLASDALRKAGMQGEVGVLGFLDGEDGDPRAMWPRRQLRLAVNLDTGFGGLIWYSVHSDDDDPISRHVWVSDNPNPPDSDPRVISDTHVPIFLARRSVLPVPRIGEAVEEFCLGGTGARPERIEWAVGQVNGLLLGAEAPQAGDDGLF